MKFKISSALKDHIGKELITDDNVAIFELVKNSYDAGAKKVKIVFEDMRSDNPKIYVIDNGKGMSEEDLENKWLFVGYSEKKDPNYIKNNLRFMAGYKGIGRFSCDKLGSKLKIITKTKTDKEFSILELDWNNFQQDQKKEFQEIPVKLKKEEKIKIDRGIISFSGTIIEITNLREGWNWKKLQNLKRYLQRLINPLQVPEGDNFEIELIAKDFVIDDAKQKYDYDRVNGIVQNVVFEKLGIKTTTIDCDISEDGKKIITKLNDKGINIFELEEEKKKEFELLKNIKVKISFLNKEAKSTFKRLMGVDVKEYGNIFVFRNGFRVLPYGETKDDWLELNLRKAQGFYRNLGTRELLGRIEINDSEDKFKELSSRSSGLINDPAFFQLKNFILEVIIKKLEKYVVGAIDWDSEREKGEKEKKDFDSIKRDTLKIIKQIAGSLENKKLKYNQDFLEIVEEKTIEKIPEIIKNIETVSKKEKDKEVRDIYSKQIQSLKQGLRFQKEKQKEELEEKEKESKEKDKEIETKKRENLFYASILSKDLQNVLNLHHHIKISSVNIKRSIMDLVKKVESNDLSPDYIRKKIQGISLENDKIYTIATFATKANFQLEGSDMKKDLVSFISDYIKNVCAEVYAGDNNSMIDFDVKINTNKEFLTWFKPIEITIILDNMINNSIKAKASRIEIEIREESNELLLNYIDNGRGIPSENKDKIFNYAFTTTNGSGMGLFHVKKILSDMEGKIKLTEKENGEKGVFFIIIFPKIK